MFGTVLGGAFILIGVAVDVQSMAVIQKCREQVRDNCRKEKAANCPAQIRAVCIPRRYGSALFVFGASLGGSSMVWLVQQAMRKKHG